MLNVVYDKCRIFKFNHYAKCYYTKCLNVVMLNVTILSVVAP